MQEFLHHRVRVCVCAGRWGCDAQRLKDCVGSLGVLLTSWTLDEQLDPSGPQFPSQYCGLCMIVGQIK